MTSRVPEQLTSFVGRERELAALRELLRHEPQGARLITLTGPPGTGKTSLALQLVGKARDLEDGVWFVPVATIRDPSLVAHAIAQVVDVREARSEPVAERLIDFLRPRSASPVSGCSNRFGATPGSVW